MTTFGTQHLNLRGTTLLDYIQRGDIVKAYKSEVEIGSKDANIFYHLKLILFSIFGSILKRTT